MALSLTDPGTRIRCALIGLRTNMMNLRPYDARLLEMREPALPDRG
jgi:hypothetical protein